MIVSLSLPFPLTTPSHLPHSLSNSWPPCSLIVATYIDGISKSEPEILE